MTKTIVIFLICIFVFMTNTVNAAFCLNEIDGVFPPPPTESTSGISIRELMIDGASYFMQSNAAANLLLNEGELSDKGYFNFTNSLFYVNDAISKLTLARQNYNDALNSAKDLEYIQEKIDKLKSFDYTGFAKANGLIVEVMDNVEKYLKKGDVKGLYSQNIAYVDSILLVLEEIKQKIEEGYKPEVGLYWDLLRKYSRTLLFGNYAAACYSRAISLSR